MERLSQDFNNVSPSFQVMTENAALTTMIHSAVKQILNKSQLVLLSPPGVFGGVETGQVSVLFDDIHLFRRPTKMGKGQKTIINFVSENPKLSAVRKENG